MVASFFFSLFSFFFCFFSVPCGTRFTQYTVLAAIANAGTAGAASCGISRQIYLKNSTAGNSPQIKWIYGKIPIAQEF